MPRPAWSRATARQSEYGLQLRTKQHAKRYYGVLEGQFRHYFEMAIEKMQGVTGENLLRLPGIPSRQRDLTASALPARVQKRASCASTVISPSTAAR